MAKARARVEAEPGSVDALMALGDAWPAVWNHREAIAVYDRVLAGRDRHALALQQRGHRRLSIRQFDLARADLERAVALDASLVDAHQSIGIDVSPTACRVVAKRLRDVCGLPEDEQRGKSGRGFVVRDLPWPEEKRRKIPPFEAMMSRNDRKKGVFVSFDYPRAAAMAAFDLLTARTRR